MMATKKGKVRLEGRSGKTVGKKQMNYGDHFPVV
jgi:hypothetical protein